MKKANLTLLYFILPLVAQAQTVWVKDSKTSFVEFKAHIQALGEPHESYAQVQLKRTRDKAKLFALKDKIKKARVLFLSGDLLEAQRAFQAITDQIYLGDWGEEQRRILFYSLLRQAQSSQEKEKRKALLTTASLLKREKITSKDQDYVLFPPPLWEELNQIQEKVISFSISWKKVFPEHQMILINGEQVPYEKDIQLPDGTYRITALSSTHAPWAKITSPSLLLSQPLLKSPSLVKGFCEFKTIKKEWLEPNMKLFSNRTCPPTLKQIHFNAKDLSKEKSHSNYLNKIKTNDFYKKNISWLGIGLGVAALGFFYSSGNGNYDAPRQQDFSWEAYLWKYHSKGRKVP